MKILVINPCKKEDYLATSIIEGLKKTKHEIYYTDEGNGADNIINDSEFIYHSKNCDYIFAIWGKSKFNGVKEPKFYLIDKSKIKSISELPPASLPVLTALPLIGG